MSGEHPIGHRPIDWGSIITVVLVLLGGIIAFVVVREKQAAMVESIGELKEKDRSLSEQIEKIKDDSRLESSINELKSQNAAMKATLEAVSDDVKDLKRRR